MTTAKQTSFNHLFVAWVAQGQYRYSKRRAYSRGLLRGWLRRRPKQGRDVRPRTTKTGTPPLSADKERNDLSRFIRTILGDAVSGPAARGYLLVLLSLSTSRSGDIWLNFSVRSMRRPGPWDSRFMPNAVISSTRRHRMPFLVHDMRRKPTNIVITINRTVQ